MSILNILLEMTAEAAKFIGVLGAGIGAGLAAIGAGQGAMEGIARQPEAAGTIRTTMIIAAALVEGVAFFAVVICLLAVL